MIVGFARVSTRITQDTETQERQLRELGITDDRIYLGRGTPGANTKRPGLAEALAVISPVTPWP